MACDLTALFKEVDVRISTQPGLTLRQLARDLRIDRRAVQEAICRSEGTHFREYKQLRCLEKTLDLLTSDESLPQKQIAWCLGYKSAAAFARFVKSRTGKTLSEIRKSIASWQKK